MNAFYILVTVSLVCLLGKLEPCQVPWKCRKGRGNSGMLLRRRPLKFSLETRDSLGIRHSGQCRWQLGLGRTVQDEEAKDGFISFI